jgi:hypothetical protein
MSTTFGPPVILNGPLPAPLPFGLFSAATIVGEPDERWGNGAVVRMYPCKVPNVWDPCSTGSDRVKSESDQAGSAPLFTAFVVYLDDQCRGGGTSEDLDERMRAAFAASEQWAVEQELATGGMMPSNPYLGDADANILGPADPVEALALLERAIGQGGKSGIIHADRQTATAWAAHSLLRVNGDKLFTMLGTPVAAGAGYDGADPASGDTATAGQGWAFGTGGVEIRRSEIEILPGSISEALDRAQNLVKFKAERDYLVTWDTCVHAAVLVDRSL